MNKKVFIRTFGCQMNTRDSEVICGLLRKEGYEIIDDPKDADVVIFNTCSVRQHAEERVWSNVGQVSKLGLKRGKKPVIGIVGCMAQNYAQAIFERSPDVDFVVGPTDIAKIPGVIKQLLPKVRRDHPQAGGVSLGFERKIWETDGLNRPEEVYHSGFYEDKKHAFVVISEGCSNFCTYCVVPYTRGQLRHRACQDILNEIKDALGKGINKFTLLGQNVNAYCSPVSGRQSPDTFIDLLKKVNGLKEVKAFDFITSHPKDTTVELFRAIADLDKLEKNLHLPVQSGSDRILRLMNRQYTRDFYLDLVESYRKIVKGGMLTTDIILGFPGETDKDFEDTYNLVKQVRFGGAYIFKYSPRPHTQAQKLSDDVLDQEKQKRHKLVLELQRMISKGLK